MKKLFSCILIFIFCLFLASSAIGASDNIKVRRYKTRTLDSWDLEIARFTSTGPQFEKKKAAVILCHGFNINNTFWDLDRRASMARYLAKDGYDVWAPSLRGSGQSSKPFLSTIRSLLKLEAGKIIPTLFKAPRNLTKFNWTIDDHIHKDIPAIIDLVKEKSGFSKVWWVGHSMGGIIMFGHLQLKGDNDIAGFISLSSMIVVPSQLNPKLKRISEQKPSAAMTLLFNTTVASQLRNLTFGIVKHPVEELLFERSNMNLIVLRRFFRKAIDDTAPGVISQFSQSLKEGKILSSSGNYSYTDNLNLIKVPMLFVIGNADGFSTETSFRTAYDAISSKDKQFTVISESNGYSANYGHCDLVLGKNSEKDVYPVISAWLNKRF